MVGNVANIELIFQAGPSLSSGGGKKMTAQERLKKKMQAALNKTCKCRLYTCCNYVMHVLLYTW